MATRIRTIINTRDPTAMPEYTIIVFEELCFSVLDMLGISKEEKESRKESANWALAKFEEQTNHRRKLVNKGLTL